MVDNYYIFNGNLFITFFNLILVHDSTNQEQSQQINGASCHNQQTIVNDVDKSYLNEKINFNNANENSFNTNQPTFEVSDHIQFLITEISGSAAPKIEEKEPPDNFGMVSEG